VKERDLSTLETTILGLSWANGPSTTYAIMKSLSRAASTFYKSRAGATYSVVKRLIGFGLMEEVPSPSGKEKFVKITDDGIVALQKWLLPPFPQGEVAFSVDFIRLRIYFLAAITPEQRTQLVDAAENDIREFEARCTGMMRKIQDLDDYYSALATLSALLECRARLKFLTIVRELMNAPPPEGDWNAALIAKLDS
jgi:DNA-binding PadR family transcriptional regulator